MRSAHVLLFSLFAATLLPSTAAWAWEPQETFHYKHWTIGKPILTGGSPGSFDEVAVKDPSIVCYAGLYHVVYTSKPDKRAKKFRDGTGYVAAATLDKLNEAPRYDLNEVAGVPVVAPQIFFFRPHKLWYIVAQTYGERRGELVPIYLTNPDIGDPAGWSKPRTLRRRRPDNGFWIDFWVICDEQKAHLFYTDHDGRMFRMETPVAQFPHGYADSQEYLAAEVRGRDAQGPWRMHEASHIYHVKSTGEYLALLEAVRPHPTRKNYWDSRDRFMFALKAERLEGPWVRVEPDENDFAGIPKYVVDKDGIPTKLDQISHPELIRAGYDERLEIDDYRLQLVIQAFDAAGMSSDYDYDFLPWVLFVMRNY